jgi:hypothetical protein
MKIFGVVLILFFPLIGSVSGQTGRCADRDVSFQKGETSIVIRKQLEPCDHLVYRFRARAGQKMKVSIGPEWNDVVFFIEGTKYLTERGSYILEGIHNNGVWDWDGILPNDDVYKIWIERPNVSNSSQKRTVPFRLRVEITDKIEQ